MNDLTVFFILVWVGIPVLTIWNIYITARVKRLDKIIALIWESSSPPEKWLASIKSQTGRTWRDRDILGDMLAPRGLYADQQKHRRTDVNRLRHE